MKRYRLKKCVKVVISIILIGLIIGFYISTGYTNNLQSELFKWLMIILSISELIDLWS